MINTFKGLFVKTEQDASGKKPVQPAVFSFPVATPVYSSPTALPDSSSAVVPDSVLAEVLAAYETGLESINMPGYDFYEFYQAVMGTGNPTAQAYTMAYNMARALDKTVTPQKLLIDAEFYLSKLNEVHHQYVAQGQQKLDSVQEEKLSNKANLNTGINQATQRIAQLESELLGLRSDVADKKDRLGKLDEEYAPQERSIQEKLRANDLAYKTSINKITGVREGIRQYVKE